MRVRAGDDGRGCPERSEDGRAPPPPGERASAAAADRRRRPQPAHRGVAHVPRAVRLHRADLAHDEPAGVVASSVAGALPVGQLRRRLPDGAGLALCAQHDAVRGARDRRRAGVEHPRRLRALTAPLARSRHGVRARPRRAHPSVPGHRDPGVRAVREAPPRRVALAAHRPELPRGRLLHLPLAAVLPDDPRGVRRRRPRRRLRRAPHPLHRLPAARQAGDRRRRPLRVPLMLQRLLRATPLYQRALGPLDALARSLAVPDDLPGRVESDDGRDADPHGSGDRRLLPGPARVRRRRDADGGQGMKLAVVGAGSTYTPELVSGLSRERERLGVREVALQDVDPERLSVVGGMARRMLDRQRFAGEVELTGDLDRAVEAADFVLVQIRVGGQAARLSDETIPLSCGCIGQETTGAGGFAKALRTVPVVLEIAERARGLAAADAWIVDFTNPVGIVTRSLLDAGHRAIGLCNVAIGFQRAFARILDVQPGRIVVDQIGLNHLPWVRAAWLDGDDVLPALLAEHGDELSAMTGGLPRRLLEELGAVPSYYLRYFYAHDRVLGEQRTGVPRAETVAEIERELLDLYRDPHVTEKPALLERRGGAFYSEAAIGRVSALAGDTGDVH